MKKWLFAASAAAVLLLGAWQWGSYGPFEVTVSTPGRNLEQVVVSLRHTEPNFSGHGSKSTYSELRVGRSNEPIRFPRRFVCFCLKAPAMRYSAFHPTFVDSSGETEPGETRHTGGVQNWRDYPTADGQLGTRVDTWLYALETFYVPNVSLPEPLIEEYLRDARRELFALPIPDDQRPPRLAQLGQIEAALRARAQR